MGPEKPNRVLMQSGCQRFYQEVLYCIEMKKEFLLPQKYLPLAFYQVKKSCKTLPSNSRFLSPVHS